MGRIVALAKRAHGRYEAKKKPDFKYDWEVEKKADNEMSAELEAIDQAAGKGLVPGRALCFGVADGTANYLVTAVRKRDVVVEWIPMGDNYFSMAVGLSPDKTRWVVNRHTAEMCCGLENLICGNKA